MRSFRLFALLSPLAFTACLSGSETTQTAGTPIDCATLATDLTGAASTLTTTASGLQYRDQTVGTGATVNAGQQVAIHYSGCLPPSGVKFDENSEPQPPALFTIGATPPQVIAGFDEGLLGMKVGGRRQLVIPPNLAYGDSAKVSIPANSTLVFTIDLVATQ